MKARLRLAAQPDAWLDVEGTTLAHAVRAGARRLGLGPGKTTRKAWLDTHEIAWWWSGVELRVRVSRSGPSGPTVERKRPVVSVTLSAEALERLDAMAATHERGRSGVVEELVMGRLPAR